MHFCVGFSFQRLITFDHPWQLVEVPHNSTFDGSICFFVFRKQMHTYIHAYVDKRIETLTAMTCMSEFAPFCFLRSDEISSCETCWILTINKLTSMIRTYVHGWLRLNLSISIFRTNGTTNYVFRRIVTFQSMNSCTIAW